MRRLAAIIGAILVATISAGGAAGALSPPDGDGDGLPDGDDLCPEYHAETQSGCREEQVTMVFTITYETGRHGRFDGFLASTNGSCRTRVPARLYQRVPGRDRRVGLDITGVDSLSGYVEIDGAIPKGTYYLRVRRHLDSKTLCRPFQSRDMRLKHRRGDIREVGPAQR